MPFFAARLRRGIAIPDHSKHGYDHTDDHLQVETLFAEEYETKDQNKDGFHMTEYLERYGCESAYADELAQVGSYSDGA